MARCCIILDPQAGWPGRYMNVWRCGGLPMVLQQLKDPLVGTILEEKGISSRFRVSISLLYYLNC